jgi:hypothetical protein
LVAISEFGSKTFTSGTEQTPIDHEILRQSVTAPEVIRNIRSESSFTHPSRGVAGIDKCHGDPDEECRVDIRTTPRSPEDKHDKLAYGAKVFPSLHTRQPYVNAVIDHLP